MAGSSLLFLFSFVVFVLVCVCVHVWGRDTAQKNGKALLGRQATFNGFSYLRRQGCIAEVYFLSTCFLTANGL